MVTSAPSLRIVFFGTPEFAVPTLEALHRSHHAVAAVVTQPDRPHGRGQRPRPGPVKQFALDRALKLLQPNRLRDKSFLVALQDLQADLGVVAAYGKILTDAVLQLPRLGLINVHASLLPKYRGAAPVHRSVMAGDVETGVTIMRVVKALDAGPMISKSRRAIGPHETSSDVERELAVLGATSLLEAVDAIGEGRARETRQDEEAATYAPKIQKADGVIDWTHSAARIHNQIRGLHPWPHAFSDLDGERIILLKSDFVPGSPHGHDEPGTILRAEGDEVTVQTGEGVLRILTLQREGRRAVSVREFLSGRPIAPGAKFARTQLGA